MERKISLYLTFLIIKINKFHLFLSNIPFHVETSHLICSANQMTGLYMTSNTEIKWIKANVPIISKTLDGTKYSRMDQVKFVEDSFRQTITLQIF